MQFDIDTASTAGSLRSIKFVQLHWRSLTQHRPFFSSTVQHSRVTETQRHTAQPVQLESEAAQQLTLTDDSQAIEKIIRHRRSRITEQLLVKWQTKAADLLVDQSSVDDPAI